ncbi:putative ABC transporter type 1, transmembrane domain superfamily [Helianthus anomalus]
MTAGGEEKTDASTSGTGDGVEDSELGIAKEKESTDTVPFYKLFAFADLTDYILMITGTVSAIGNGICLPLMTILLGDLINSFGHNQNSNVVDVVSKVRTYNIYITCKLIYLDYVVWSCELGKKKCCHVTFT